MKFPTFLATFLLAAVVIAVPFVSAAVERERDDRTTRPDQEEQPPREEPPAPDRDEENEAPQGNVVYNKSGVVIHVDENGETTTVTVSIDGKIASKLTHTGSTDNNDGGDDSAPGEDGEDGSDGDDNGGTPPEDEDGGPEEDDDRGRPEREDRVR